MTCWRGPQQCPGHLWLCNVAWPFAWLPGRVLLSLPLTLFVLLGFQSCLGPDDRQLEERMLKGGSTVF